MQVQSTGTLDSMECYTIDDVYVNCVCSTHAKAFSPFSNSISNHPMWTGKSLYQLEYTGLQETENSIKIT